MEACRRCWLGALHCMHVDGVHVHSIGNALVKTNKERKMIYGLKAWPPSTCIGRAARTSFMGWDSIHSHCNSVNGKNGPHTCSKHGLCAFT